MGYQDGSKWNRDKHWRVAGAMARAQFPVALRSCRLIWAHLSERSWVYALGEKVSEPDELVVEVCAIWGLAYVW